MKHAVLVLGNMARALLASVAAVALLAASAEAAVLTTYSEISVEFGFNVQQKWSGAGSTIFAYTDPGTYSSPSCVSPHTFVEAHPGSAPILCLTTRVCFFARFDLLRLRPTGMPTPATLQAACVPMASPRCSIVLRCRGGRLLLWVMRSGRLVPSVSCRSTPPPTYVRSPVASLP